jgi:predicted O-methyltransferase YrrM
MAPRHVRQLAMLPDPRAQMIGSAIGAALTPGLAADEKMWIDRIEELRRLLTASNDEIVVVDYGAGARPGSSSPEEMVRGKPTTYRVGDFALVSMSPRQALLLFQLLRRLKPRTCLELGTAMGVSAAYQGAALELNGMGRLISLEGAPNLAELARRNLHDLGITVVTIRVGRFVDSLPAALQELTPLEFAFVDGHHDRDATIGYFLQLLPHLTDDAVVVFDDINWSRGMRDAWRAVREHARVPLSVELGKVGLVVVGPPRGERAAVRIPFG